MTETDLAYWAGLIDGEGCVWIIKRRSHDYGLCISVEMSGDIKPEFDLARSAFGGSVYTGTHKAKKLDGSSRKVTHTWQVRGNDALRFLKAIAPYIRLKTKVIGNCILFQEYVQSVGRVKELSQLELNTRAEFFHKQASLKTQTA